MLEPVKETPVPLLQEQIQAGMVLAWFHDISLEPMKTYQYRIRLKLENPLLAQDRIAKPVEDAERIALYSPFSPWSEPVFVPQVTEFFLSGYNVSSGTVKVTVFARALGQTVKQNFSVAPGWSVGENAKVKVTDPDNGESSVQMVDFSTGVVLLAVDFAKVIQTSAFPKSTVEILYLDKDGRLHTRTQADDDASDRREQLLKESRQAEGSLAGR